MKYVFKISYLRNTLIVSSIIAIALPLCIFLFVFPSLTKMLIMNTEDEALRVARHLNSMIIGNQTELSRNSLNVETLQEAKRLKKLFELMKLKIFSKSGEIIYSTEPKDIGKINKKRYFHDSIAKGEDYAKLVKKDTPSLEEQIMTSDVVETYVPIIKNGAVIGALEIYYNITDRKATLDKLVFISRITLSIMAFLLLGVIIIVLIKSGNTISRREQAEEALRESEERYRNLYEEAPAGYVEFDTEGRIINVNKKELEMFGYTYEEMVGQFMWDFVLEKEDALKTIKAKMSGGMSPGKGLERTYIRKDGTMFPVLIDDFIFKDKDGQIKGNRAIHRDITDRKQAEEKNKRLEAQLVQAQKMEAIGTLAGGIAHDFNNVLSPIMIHSEMVMMDFPSDSPIQFNLKEIFKAGERARDMVKQILTFSRKEEGKRAEIKIIPVLKEVLKMLRSSIPTTIDIQQNLEAESDTVLADPTQINQILLNFGTNAAHAMREKGGILKVSLVREDLDSNAAEQYPDLNPGSYLKLTVSDTGHGIDDETMQRIFEPYFTTKAPGEGTGMGLALIHGIVKSYDGDITVESEPGKGTTFNVYLPRIEVDVSQVEEPSVPLPGGTERILLVDDEMGAVDAIQPMLENLGYNVTARTSSIEALEAFRNKADQFDLVITDMTMPNMTGKDLAKGLISIRSDIPIILCTGFSEQIDERRSEEMGISAFVMKPIVMREMANTIREVLVKK